MYSRRSNLILGFHGCDKTDQEKLLTDTSYFKKSEEDFDWLGHGMYFWENDPKRAMEWAEQKKVSNSIETPASIGAVIDLGYCLDLMDSASILIVKRYYEILKMNSEISRLDIPKNTNHPKDSGNDKILRRLDCAVLELIHSEIKKARKTEFDSVRAVFTEGDKIYPDAGFWEKTHIQICIRNPNCIKGLFLPREKVVNFRSL